jgi:predicted metalloprotease with PDZ domain
MQDLMEFAFRMYAIGPSTIFALDMEMRRATKGERGVLDLLHHLMDQYVAKDRGFGEDELDDVLLAVGGEPARAFFERYIDGAELPDPAQFLDVIGYREAAGQVESVSEPSAAQLAARRDYFSITGKP